MEWDIFGHEWAARLLQQHIARGESRHAYLFTGPPGIGRRTLALRFAQALNCTQPPEPGVPCGTCRSCRQIGNMQHPDLFITQADSEGGTLKVDQVRELQRSLALTPYEARYRVAMLLRFEEAHPSAQNAILKTLEEPPPRAVLLVTALAADNLLPTIVSRCEVIRLGAAPLDRLEQALQTRWNIPAEEARFYAHLSDGRTGAAVRLHTNPEALEIRAEAIADMQNLLTENRRARLNYAEKASRSNQEASKQRERLRPVLRTWLSYWRDVMLCTAGSSAALTNIDHEAEIRSLAQRVDLATARARVSDLERGIARLDAYINPRMLLDVLLLDMPYLN